MKFYQFAQALRPYFMEAQTQKDFVILLFDKIALYEDVEEINPIYDISTKTAERLYSDENRGIPKNLASNIFKHIYKDQFEKFLEKSLNEDLYEQLATTFRPYFPDINSDNLFSSITEIFSNILEEEARKKKTFRKTNIEQMPIDSQICLIFEHLKKLDIGNITPIKYNSYTIKNKIPNDVFLQQKILNYVAEYYDYIKKYLKQSEKQSIIDSTRIGSMISEEFKIQSKRFRNREDIFNELVNWLSQRTNTSISACEIVISYFVQNCEVFDATSK